MTAVEKTDRQRSRWAARDETTETGCRPGLSSEQLAGEAGSKVPDLGIQAIKMIRQQYR